VFDVGFWELTFIMTLALLVLGPDKLPGLVRSLGRWMGRARSVARNLRVQIEREVAEMPSGPASKPAKPGPAASPSPAAEGSEKSPESSAQEEASEKDSGPAEVSDPKNVEKSSEPGSRF
jgi:sec-independent protein translocase protein TatB